MNKHIQKNKIATKSNQGMSLVELLVVIGILATVIIGLVQIFIAGAVLSDISNRKTIALGEAQDKLEDIRNHAFGSITTDYASGGVPGSIFNLSQVTGTGVIVIDSTDSNLLKIDVVVSFRDKSNRTIGEDKNLNGILDAGEDADVNGLLDSPIKLSTYIRPT